MIDISAWLINRWSKVRRDWDLWKLVVGRVGELCELFDIFTSVIIVEQQLYLFNLFVSFLLVWIRIYNILNLNLCIVATSGMRGRPINRYICHLISPQLVIGWSSIIIQVEIVIVVAASYPATDLHHHLLAYIVVVGTVRPINSVELYIWWSTIGIRSVELWAAKLGGNAAVPAIWDGNLWEVWCIDFVVCTVDLGYSHVDRHKVQNFYGWVAEFIKSYLKGSACGERCNSQNANNERRIFIKTVCIALADGC